MAHVGPARKRPNLAKWGLSALDHCPLGIILKLCGCGCGCGWVELTQSAYRFSASAWSSVWRSHFHVLLTIAPESSSLGVLMLKIHPVSDNLFTNSGILSSIFSTMMWLGTIDVSPPSGDGLEQKKKILEGNSFICIVLGKLKSLPILFWCI